MSQVEPSHAVVTGSVFQNSFNDSEIEQFQGSGRFEFGDYSGLDFGVALTETYNRTAAAVMQRDTWGGVGSPDDYDDSLWYADNMAGYFDSFSNHNDPRFTDRYYACFLEDDNGIRLEIMHNPPREG